MGRLKSLLRMAARHLAANPKVREKATEIYEGKVKPGAKSLYENEVKPRAKAAWRKGKPKMEAARDEIRKIAREADPRKDPKKFAAKVKERFFGRKG